jgi:maltose-binding protein MalE
LCENFFEQERQEIMNRISESKVLENSKNSFNFIVIISVFLNSYLESRILNKKFEDYMVMRAEKEFQLSQQKKIKVSQQNDKKTVVKEEPIIESKSESQKRDLPL